MMLDLPITSIAVAVAAIALVPLSMNVSFGRMKAGLATGYPSDEALVRRARAQGNYIEYVPIALILIAVLEATGESATGLWTLAGALALGRASHAVGMLTGSTPLRAGGMLLTYFQLVAGAVMLLT
jgi:uncharacterized membrane protein YecN with MAPEG domain